MFKIKTILSICLAVLVLLLAFIPSITSAQVYPSSTPSASASATGSPSASPAPSASAGAVDQRFNQAGNILISDQFNNRVIEITKNGDIVWQYGIGPTDQSDSSILGVNDAQRVGTNTLMAGTGVPAATPALEPGGEKGFPDNRVLLVDQNKNILWQYGQFGVTGSGDNQLDTPVQSTWLPDGTVLITDQGNQRIINVNMDKKIIWQYGTTGTSGKGDNQLNDPNSAELLANGNILIADENNNRAIEVDRNNKINATFTAGGTVSGVAFASRLPSGNTLLTDSNNSRIVEVDKNDKVVWEYFTNKETGSNDSPLPTRALRLADGTTIISDQFNDRVITVDQNKNIVTTYGTLNKPGFGTQSATQGLAAPYDAKVIGDYTGITPPSTAATASPSASPAATPSGSPSPGASPSAFTINTMSKTGIGTYLVDSKGMTLYFTMKDSVGKSVVAGDTLKIWPVFFTPNISVPTSLTTSDFGSITRSDGAMQTTFRGFPLYFFANDKAPGDTNGEGIGGVWFAVTPSNFPPTPSASATP